MTGVALADWEGRGWAQSRGAVDRTLLAELIAALEVIERTASDGGGLHHFEATNDGTRIARSEFFADDTARLASFIRDGEIANTLATLFGEPATLFKEKVNYKYPGGGGFAPHQDITAYPQVNKVISALVALDPASVDNGCLWFAASPGVVLPHEGGRISPAWVDSALWQPVEAAPGDVVFFDGLAPHFSDTNNSNERRRALYLTYNAASDGDHRSTYYKAKRALLDEEARSVPSNRLRISYNDDFLGKPAVAPGTAK